MPGGRASDIILSAPLPQEGGVKPENNEKFA